MKDSKGNEVRFVRMGVRGQFTSAEYDEYCKKLSIANAKREFSSLSLEKIKAQRDKEDKEKERERQWAREMLINRLLCAVKEYIDWVFFITCFVVTRVVPFFFLIMLIARILAPFLLRSL